MNAGLSVSQIAERFGFAWLAGHFGSEGVVKDVYIGDLLSWVMGRATEGCAWITIQGHVNVAAVALLTGAACVILAEGADADAAMLKKADDEGIPVLSTPLTAYQAAKLFMKLDLEAEGLNG